MAELALEVSQAQLGADDARSIMRQFATQLERVRGSLVSNDNPRGTTVDSQPNTDERVVNAGSTGRDPIIEEDSVPRQFVSRKRSRVLDDDGEIEDGSDVGDDDAGALEELAGRNLIPWRRPGFQGSVIVNDDPILRRVNESLSAWNRKKSTWQAVFQDLSNQLGKPPFPVSEWKNLVQGQVIDLDKVFSQHKRNGITSKVSEKIGVLELSLDTEPTGKRVSGYTDWSVAWEDTMNAYLYVWPKCFPELAAYRQHISALSPETHH